MTEDLIIHLGQDALRTTAMLAAPLLLSTLVVGLGVSISLAGRSSRYGQWFC